MLPLRLILISAFMLAGALTATAQSPEPGQSAPSAPSQSTAEPESTQPAQSPLETVHPESETAAPIPSGTAEATPAQADPTSEAATAKREDTQVEPKDADTQGVGSPAETAPDTAQSAPTTSGAPSGKTAIETTTEEKTNAPEPSSEATNGPDTKANAPAASSGSDTPAAASDDAKAAAPEVTPATPEATAAAHHPTLAVDTGGGAFAQAYKQVVLEPFEAKTGVTLRDAPGEGTTGDLLLLDAAELARRCASGELISLELSGLNPTATAPAAPDDYLNGALKPCGIAALSWSNLFVYDPAKFERRAPRTVADVFDTRRYPGKRALPRDGRGLVEALLVADGVAPGDVYSVLETSDGINRILKRLKSLGANIVWYEQLSDAIALVREGKAAIAFTSNGHAFIEQARSGALGLIWDGQVLHASYFAIPKSTSDEASAKELVAFATRPEQLAGLVRQIPYGPMRRSAITSALGLRHAVTGQELGPYLPTAPENLRTAVRFDPVWWGSNLERIESALRIVRQGPPLPARP